MGIIADIRQVADYLKQHVNIVDVMKEEIQLERAGSDLYKALCCFHEEKTPSLTVTPSKGLYHCFGCKASGDIITFYQQYYNMSVMEAIRAIADKFGIDISRFERELTEDEKRKLYLQSVNGRLQEALTRFLLEVPGNRGLEYLKERGIGEEVIRDFGLGYSPGVDFIHSTLPDVKNEDLAILELGVHKENMWNDAVIYPLFDPYGKVIGFKSRPHWHGQTHDEKGRKLPKFLGTSSSSPLHMDNHIYGLHVARKHIVNGKLIAVEGQHDVLRAHQHNIKNVVGADGTALNKQKLELLESFGVRELIVIYDGDKAGREASLKLAKQAAEFETSISIKIGMLPEGYDPDEFIAEHGRVAFLKVAYEAVYASQYLIDQVANEMPINSVTGKIDFIKRTQPVIAKAPSYEQKFLIAYIAEKINIDPMVIEDMIRAEQARGARSVLYNIEGERIVLGGMLRDEDFRADLLLEMKVDDWYVPKHGMLFGMIKEMEESGVPISIETVKATMNNKEYNQVFAEGAYIDEIFATVGDYRTIKDDLIDKAMRRKLIKQADELKKNASNLKNRVVLVIEEHYDAVQKITDASDNDSAIDGQSGAIAFMNTLHERMKNPGKITGIDIGEGWSNVTRILNGIQKKKLITIAANQSVGKTTLLANWLNNIAITQRLPWVHFTLEMPNEEMVQKIIGIRAGVNTQKIERGNLTDEEYRRVQQAAIDYHEGGLILIDDVVTLEGIMNMTRKLIRTHGIVGISIDYIQLMMLERRHNLKKFEEEGQISGALKNDVAKALDIPVIILSQMSRRALDREIQKAEDGQGAYKIAQDSDIYMILQEKSKSEIEEYGLEHGNMRLNIDKNRGGQGDVLLDLHFMKDVQKMMEVEG